jgi:hypothetical protein
LVEEVIERSDDKTKMKALLHSLMEKIREGFQLKR